MRGIHSRLIRSRRGELLFFLILFAGPAAAGPLPPDSTGAAASSPERPSGAVIALDWADIARFVDRHPRLSAGKSQIDAARGGVDAAGAIPNPTLEGAVGEGFSRTDETSSTEWGLNVTIPLGWIAQRGSRVDAAEAALDIAVAESRSLRRDVLLQLRILFWNLAYEQARVASLEELEAQTAALVDVVIKRVEKGEIRPVEAPRVEIELEKVASELESARAALGVRQAELALWLGEPAGKTIVVDADMDALPPAVDRESALAAARSSDPAFELARSRTRVLEAEVGIEKTARVPAFSISGFTTYELDRRAYGVELAVDLPLWNWNTGRIAQAEAMLAAGKKQTEAVGLEIEAAVIEAQAACETSVAAATRLRNSVLPRAEIAASTMEKAYRLGEANLLEVIDARRTLLEVRRLYLGALAQAQIDRSRLGAFIGEEPK
jgi:cobalt-zinc-cadmium efflux system outer membrane protein